MQLDYSTNTTITGWLVFNPDNTLAGDVTLSPWGVYVASDYENRRYFLTSQEAFDWLVNDKL